MIARILKHIDESQIGVMKFWHTGATQALTGIGAILAIGLLTDMSPAACVAWASVWFICHQILTGFGAIGAHLLFCHRSYKTTRLKEIILALGGTLLCIGSPIQWNAGHTAHHDHSDTDQDPHNAKTWRGLFLGRYNRPQKYDFRFGRHLIVDPFHRKLHTRALTVPVLFSLFLALIGLVVIPEAWYLPLLFVYVSPLFTALMAGAIHNVVSHAKSGPRDMPFWFWLMPWEWAHGSHHEDPSNPNKAYKYRYLFDPAYWVVQAIRTDK